VKFHDTSNYAKGIKAVDSILSKHPNHGETLSLKGLILSKMDESKLEEAYACVKNGIKNNFASPFSWFVYGQIYKKDGNYTEALKCYLQAHRLDGSDDRVLSELSSLQIHARDFSGFLESKLKLINLRGMLKANWYGAMVGHYFLGNYEQAIALINHFESVIPFKLPTSTSSILLRDQGKEGEEGDGKQEEGGEEEEGTPITHLSQLDFNGDISKIRDFREVTLLKLRCHEQANQFSEALAALAAHFVELGDFEDRDFYLAKYKLILY
jgi:tetratricopeptide (TPR) repeat protein